MFSLFSFTFLLFAAGTIAKVWYSIPLIVAVSIVYGATRHERIREIVQNAIRTCIWILVFMGLIFLLVWSTGFFI